MDRALVATLGDHVGGIGFRRADEEVLGPNARRVVARVADELPCSNLPARKRPSEPVRAPQTTAEADPTVPAGCRVLGE